MNPTLYSKKRGEISLEQQEGFWVWSNDIVSKHVEMARLRAEGSMIWYR